MDRLQLYRVNIDYIKYLYNFDKKIQYNTEEDDNYTERRPYVGIVIKIGEHDYYAPPLESPKRNHKGLKRNEKSKFHTKVFCDFKLLEEKCKEYKNK